jgi:hypothetical protein
MGLLLRKFEVSLKLRVFRLNQGKYILVRLFKFGQILRMLLVAELKILFGLLLQNFDVLVTL